MITVSRKSSLLSSLCLCLLFIFYRSNSTLSSFSTSVVFSLFFSFLFHGLWSFLLLKHVHYIYSIDLAKLFFDSSQITMVPKAIWNACALPAQSVIASAARKKTAGLRQGLLDQGLMPFAVLRRVMRTKTS